MRKLKFRLWSKVAQCIIEWEDVERKPHTIFDNSKWIPMQFTGLKDCKGVEIYEGDIVRYYQPYAKRTDEHIVKWDSEFACFGLFEDGNKWCKENDWVKIQGIEVVGNFYTK